MAGCQHQYNRYSSDHHLQKINWGEPERAPHKRYSHARNICMYIYMYGTTPYICCSNLAKYTEVHAPYAQARAERLKLHVASQR